MEKITLNHLDALGRGVAFLGSGGRGDKQTLMNTVKQKITTYGDINLVDPMALFDDAIILTIELVGAHVPEHQRHQRSKIGPLNAS